MGSIPIARSNVQLDEGRLLDSAALEIGSETGDDMLKRLTVSNLAIVEKAEAEFAPGLNVLTGETGAGKSVLMGALELVLGARADGSVVRDGAKEARVDAEFEFGPGADGACSGVARAVAEILEECGIEQEDEGRLTIRRTVGGGGARAWVNDCPATVATLRRIGRLLVDIHGPRANQSILEERFQRAALDSFGGVDAAAYEAAWEALSRIEEERARLEDEQDVAGEIDMLRFQTGEIEEAGISAEDDDIAARHAAAAHAGEVVEAANDVTEALGGDGGLSELLSRVQARLRGMAKYMAGADVWQAEAEELAVRADELSRSVADAVSRLDADPGELERLDARLGVVNRLKRKYQAQTAAELAELLEAKRARLAELEGRGERIEELRKAGEEARRKVEASGAALSGARAKAGARLAKAVTEELRGLGFVQAKFAVAVSPAPPSRTGCDRVEYVFEPNPGESARPLAAIASSGEAARVMLALKSVLAMHDGTDLLVFDEIDANIGGETGRAVGERMRAVAGHHQVVAITHLPQSAAYGGRHMVVSKHVSGGRTRTGIAPVEGEERVAEIGRMLGGGAAALEHARDLLARVAAGEPCPAQGNSRKKGKAR